MTIGGVNCGARQPPAVNDPDQWISTGVSMARDSVQISFAGVDQLVKIHFSRMTQSTHDSLKTALETTAKPGGIVAVVPDSGDDLGIGAGGSVNLIYQKNGFRSTYLYGTYFAVDITLRYLP